MPVISDQQQREFAIDGKRSFIVQAPAGSGKTELLIQRFLGLLAKVNQPEEILAITFTRKAAAEMADRVIQAIQRAQYEPEPPTDPARKTWHIAQAVLKQDHQHNWQLLLNPHRLRIQTIDALCASLTRQMPVLSQFGAQPDIAEDPSLLYRQAVRNFLETLDANEVWSDAIAEILLHLDNQYSQVENLLVAMLATRDQWLPHLTTTLHLDNLRQLLEAELESIAAERLQALNLAFEHAHRAELFELLTYACEQLQAQQIISPILRCAELVDLPPFTPSYLSHWQAIASFFLTQKNAWRKKVTVKEGFPPTHKAMKARYLALINDCANEKVRQVLEDIIKTPPCRLTENQWQILSALITVLRILSGFLWLAFQEHNTVDYIEIAQRALLALGSADDPSQLALQLDYRIQHILVDEFQDTSATQFRLLEKLTAGWQPNDGRTLFIVGDPMQSIYRFRKAEVGLFLQAEQHGIGHIKLDKLTLTTNFRSQQQLVEWFNNTFSEIFPNKADSSMGAVPYSQAVGILPAKQQTAVALHIYPNQTEAETQHVVSLIQHYLAENPSITVAVLVRARSHLTDIIPALQRAHIAYRAVEIESLNHKPVIHDLLALTRAMLFLDDRIAWLAVLRAPWCGLSHADLLAIAGHSHTPLEPIWESLQSLEQYALTIDGLQRCQHLIATIKPYLMNRGRMPLPLWIESIWLKLGGPAGINHATELEDAKTFYQLIAKLQQGDDIANIELLEKKLTELYAAPNNDPDVRVELMTIHKSKGLEFDVVILPALDKKGAADGQQLLLFTERPMTTHSLGLVLAPIKASEEEQDPIYHYVRHMEKQKADYELSRLLYVAVTRARQHLHLLGQVSQNKKDTAIKFDKSSLLAKLWPTMANNAIEQLANSDSQAFTEVNFEKNRLQRLVGYKLTSAKAMPVNDAPKAAHINFQRAAYEPRALALKQIGVIIHRILYRLSQLPESSWAALIYQPEHWRTALIQLGVSQNELNFAVRTIHTAIQQTLNDKRGRWLLANTYCEAQSEFPISYFNGELTKQFIIDRTFIDDMNTRWIIDYKSTLLSRTDLATACLKHKAQLETYAAILSQQDERPIKLGLYFPMLPAWYAWDYNSDVEK